MELKLLETRIKNQRAVIAKLLSVIEPLKDYRGYDSVYVGHLNNIIEDLKYKLGRAEEKNEEVDTLSEDNANLRDEILRLHKENNLLKEKLEDYETDLYMVDELEYLSQQDKDGNNDN